MDKYKLLATVLGLENFSLKSGLLGGKPFASFNEEQLQAIENALAEKTGVTAEQLQQLQTNLQEQQETNQAIETAVTAAMEQNGLEATGSVVEQVELLGNTCKEYGEKQTTHTLLQNDGKDTASDDDLIEGYLDPNAEHNQILANVLN